MTNYTKAVKVGKWCKYTRVLADNTQSPLNSVVYYSKKIGTSGYGGCSFYEMKPHEFTALIHYFNEFNIPYLEFNDQLNYDPETVWWSYKEYRRNSNENTKTLAGRYSICSAGYEFIITTSAYEKIITPSKNIPGK